MSARPSPSPSRSIGPAPSRGSDRGGACESPPARAAICFPSAEAVIGYPEGRVAVDDIAILRRCVFPEGSHEFVLIVREGTDKAGIAMTRKVARSLHVQLQSLFAFEAKSEAGA